MGRSPCCTKEGLNRGAWTAMEDKALTDYIAIHGEGHWRGLPKRAGLKRCGKSCRLRWLNYLRPDIKRGNISVDEEELIIRLHKLLGNRWSLIAGRLPGRTDNEIKNYWNTNLSKKVQGNYRRSNRKEHQNNEIMKPLIPLQAVRPKKLISSRAIRTKAVKCTGRVLIRTPLTPPTLPLEEPLSNNPETRCSPTLTVGSYSNTNNLIVRERLSEDTLLDISNTDFNMLDGLSFSEFLESQQILDFCCDFNQETCNKEGQFSPSSLALEEPIVFSEEMMDDWRRSGCGLDVVTGVEMWLRD